MYGQPGCAPCEIWGDKLKEKFADDIEIIKLTDPLEVRSKMREFNVSKVPFVVKEGKVLTMAEFPKLLDLNLEA